MSRCQLRTWNPGDLKSLVMRSLIFALSVGGIANEFNASSENSRCSVRETCSPASTIPYETSKQVTGLWHLHTRNHSNTVHVSAVNLFLIEKRNVKATNPRNGPLPTVFPLDGNKLQDRALGDRVRDLCSFGIYFPSARQWQYIWPLGIYTKKTAKCTKFIVLVLVLVGNWASFQYDRKLFWSVDIMFRITLNCLVVISYWLSFPCLNHTLWN